MQRRTFLLALASAALLPAVPALAAPPSLPGDKATPEEIVRVMYARMAAEVYDHLIEKKPRQRYYSASTAALLEKVFRLGDKRNEPSIDYEPLIDGQDGEVKELQVVTVSSDAAKAVVEARFVSFGDKVTVGFDFVNEKGVWRIQDIRGREGTSLRAIAAEYLKS